MIGVSTLWFIVEETSRASKTKRPRRLMEMRIYLFKSYTTLILPLYGIGIICLYLVVYEPRLTIWFVGYLIDYQHHRASSF
jgi:hypothetical protein